MALTCEIWTRFFKKYIVSGNITEKKNNTFERFLIFFNIKISAKSKNIELNEEFIAMWRKEQSLWDVMCPLHRERNEKRQKLEKIEILDSEAAVRRFPRKTPVLAFLFNKVAGLQLY